MTALNLKIIDHTEMEPEVLAMLQAFYSRSPMPIEDRLASLAAGEGTKEQNIKKAMKTYYVDYGHASIGECGGTTVFIENVSMLAAKAIQDTPLYVGQECSTRYIDFTNHPFIVPAPNRVFDSSIQEQWRALYVFALPKAIEWAKDFYYPDQVLSSKIKPENVSKAFEATCRAIAFDICRGLLPAGASTSLAWTGSFRTFSEHLNLLSFHSLAEVRALAKTLYAQFLAKYPSSFKDVKLNEADLVERNEVFYSTNQVEAPYLDLDCVMWDSQDAIADSLDIPALQRYRRQTDKAITFAIQGTLDFGSYRDLQRHRPGVNLMPMLRRPAEFDPALHMDQFYVERFNQIDPTLMDKVKDIMDSVCSIDAARAEAEAQYILPMALLVPVYLRWDLGQLQYVMRLRSKTSVHPTLRTMMQRTYGLVNESLPRIAKHLDVDLTPHYFASDRGEQTFKTRSLSELKAVPK